MRVCIDKIYGKEHRSATTRVAVDRVVGRYRVGGVAHAAIRSHVTAQAVFRKSQMMTVVVRYFRFRLHLVDMQARYRRKDVEVAEHIVLQIEVIVPLSFRTEFVVPRVIEQSASNDADVNLSTQHATL